MSFEEPSMYILFIIVAFIVSIIVIYAMRQREREVPEERKLLTDSESTPFKIVKTVRSQEAKLANEELRLLGLEREILSDAIRRLYEAQAEGKITEEEREKLAQIYKSRMIAIKESISKDESVVALHQFEAMQEDLMQLFSDRFDELNKKVEDLREKVDVKPFKEFTFSVAETPTPTPEEQPDSQKERKRGRKKPPVKSVPKTEAEKRIEEIRAEVERVLDRLGQMEIET